MRPSEVVSEDELEVIHLASLRILRDIGMDFLDAEARRLLAEAGADVDGDGPRVRFDPDMVLERIATAPSTFRLHARNPDHSLAIGGPAMAFGSVASAFYRTLPSHMADGSPKLRDQSSCTST